MSQTGWTPPQCPYCGMGHVSTRCPRVQSIKYHPDGLVAEVVFHPPKLVVNSDVDLNKILTGDK